MTLVMFSCIVYVAPVLAGSYELCHSNVDRLSNLSGDMSGLQFSAVLLPRFTAVSLFLIMPPRTNPWSSFHLWHKGFCRPASAPSCRSRLFVELILVHVKEGSDSTSERFVSTIESLWRKRRTDMSIPMRGRQRDSSLRI